MQTQRGATAAPSRARFKGLTHQEHLALAERLGRLRASILATFFALQVPLGKSHPAVRTTRSLYKKFCPLQRAFQIEKHRVTTDAQSLADPDPYPYYKRYECAPAFVPSEDQEQYSGTLLPYRRRCRKPLTFAQHCALAAWVKHLRRELLDIWNISLRLFGAPNPVSRDLERMARTGGLNGGLFLALADEFHSTQPEESSPYEYMAREIAAEVRHGSR